MPRIRSVHPELCQDEDLAALDDPSAERTFVRLWTHLDDEGRAVDNPKLLKAALYPLHDSMTAETVNRDLEVLAGVGMILRYERDGKRYLCAKAGPWKTYQKPRHPSPSKYPPPSDDHVRSTAKRRNGSAEGRRPHAGEERSGDGGGERGRRTATAQRAPDLLFENLAGACGWPLKDLTDGSRGKLNAAAGELRNVQADPALIPKFPAWWRTTYPNVQLTPHCVSNHWPAFMASRNGSSPPANVVKPPWKCPAGNPECKDGRFFGEDGQMHKCACRGAKR